MTVEPPVVAAAGPLDRLGKLAGIASSYVDSWGEEHRLAPETRQTLLAAMGLSAGSDGEIAQSLAVVERRLCGAPLPPVVVLREGEAAEIPLTLPAHARGLRLAWRLTLEGGTEVRDSLRWDSLPPGKIVEIDGLNHQRRLLRIDPPPLGYHRFALTIGEETVETTIVMAPRRCYRPPSLEGDSRRWGIAVQLYGLRSPRNWGIGDFTDLATLVRGAARRGAAAVGLNPLHALFPRRPEHASPYSPSSRLFLNPLYLDVEAIEDFSASAPARRLIAAPDFQARLAALRQSALVDYPGVAACKLPVLELLHRSFRERCLGNPGDERAAAFQTYRAGRGDALRRYALFEALAERNEEQFGADWHNWPEGATGFEAEALAAFAAAEEERVEFHEYLQWQAELQLDGAVEVARRTGLSIGIYSDLAVGADGGGAEAWAWQDLLVWDAHVGAPPDSWNAKGQDWGLRPFNPLALRERAYAPFAELLRANMRKGGALRIDHILGLMRLFWIPAGAPATEGAYVAYPWRELMAVLALESRRNRCLVVGEDLGTVPEGMREALAEAGILGYRLFYFEHDDKGGCRPAEDYSEEALVGVSTHDLPTLPGFWRGEDLALFDKLALWPTPQHRAREREGRERSRRAILETLRARGLLGAESGEVLEARLPEAVYRFLAETPSKLLMVQLEDVIGQTAQLNLPGTHDEYPNWRAKFALNLDDLLEDPRVRRLAEQLDALRGDQPHFDMMRPAEGAAPPAIPRATYRIQFTADFTFDDASRILRYLAALGVSHLYGSPWLQARPHSTHGYDITDHNHFNSELGGEGAFGHMALAVAQQGMGQLLDFVPNHMGIGAADNEWWLDLLEWGEDSPYAGYFDVDWESTNIRLRNKILLPLLGDHYGTVLEAGDLVPRFDPASGSYAVWYFQHRLPIAPRDYPALLQRALDAIGDDGEAGRLCATLGPIVAAFTALERGRGRAGRAELRAKLRALQLQLAELALVDPVLADCLARGAASLAGRKGERDSFRPLHRLLERQHYRLAFWGVAGDEINYRRFFNIDDLAGMRVENPALFEPMHRLVKRLIAERRLHGLRIDHIDGLYDPAGYCTRLQSLAPQEAANDAGGKPLYVVVEKILARHERLREDWPIAGTTGYDFLAQLNGLFVDARQEAAMSRLYRRFTGRDLDYEELAYATRHLVMESLLGSELRVLAEHLYRIAEGNWLRLDYTLEGLRRAIEEIVACFPVYRSYVTEKGAVAEDRRDIRWAVSQARKHWKGPGREVLDFVESALTADLAQPRSGYGRNAVLRFAMKFQQYSGPVAAKGIEDTAFYRYHRLVSLNEVGGDPRQFGLTPAAFHHQNQEQARLWPHGMLATATHDTKRGEDTRARLNALSEMPAAWGRRAARWASLNRRKKREIEGRAAPGRNDEYLLYQTMLGAWPVELTSPEPDEAWLGEFAGRLKAYMQKAVREAKERSSWQNPDAEYEAALEGFIERILDPRAARPFLQDFLAFQPRVATLGMLNGLAQTALKLTSPGVPDIYQGSELWDLSLVDPDNRRPVDFARRARILQEAIALAALPEARRSAELRGWREHWQDGRIKLYLIHRLLSLRRDRPALFEAGAYAPLEAEGGRAEHVFAFSRSREGESVIVAVGRLFAALLPQEGVFPAPEAWQGTTLRLPQDGARPYRDILTGRQIEPEAGGISASRLFEILPAAVLLSDD